MSNKLNDVETLLKAIKSNNKNDKETINKLFEQVNDSIDVFINYHNEAVRQGELITLARFRMDEDKFIDYITKLHEHRKALHKNMIDQAIVLNTICKNNKVNPLYTGPLNTDKGRDDPDTRFGVAEFCEQLCHDFFKTTHETSVPEPIKKVYRDYSKNIMTNSERWSLVDEMMEKSKARLDMDVTK